MKILHDYLSAPEIQEYFYDCLKATWARMLSLQSKKTLLTHPWRDGDLQINIIGVRGYFRGVVRGKNLQGQYDDAIFVARKKNGLKEVFAFEASLDYSTGTAPILIEGSYRYYISIHNRKYFVVDNVGLKWGDKEGIYYGDKYSAGDNSPPVYQFESGASANAEIVVPDPDKKKDEKKKGDEKKEEKKVPPKRMITVPVVVTKIDGGTKYRRMSSRELELWNKQNRYHIFNGGVPSKKAYIGLKCDETFVARDLNQNNVFDPGESSAVESVGINIHYGGSGERVRDNSAGCQVIRGKLDYNKFIGMLCEDLALRDFRFWFSGEDKVSGGANSVDPLVGRSVEVNNEINKNGRGNDYVIYTLVEAPFFEHFLQSQFCCPLGEVRLTNFGRMHPLESHDVSRRIAEPENVGKFIVSGNAQWHSGIHLPAATASERVLAPMAGRIVAARLKQIDSVADSSTNFILIEHVFRRQTEPVFTLLMHLKDQEFTSEGIKDRIWLKRFFGDVDLASEHSKLKSGKVAICSIPVLPGEVLGEVGKMGKEKGVHFEVFSGKDIYEPELIPQKSSPSSVALGELKFSGFNDKEYPQSIMILSISKGDTYALPGKDTLFEVETVYKSISPDDLKKISWNIKVISEEGGVLKRIEEKMVGPVYKFSVPDGSEFQWSEIVAQPYISETSPRLAIFRRIIPAKIFPVQSEESPVSPVEGKKAVIRRFLDFAGDAIREGLAIQVRQDIESAKTQAEILQVSNRLFTGKESKNLQTAIENMRIAAKSTWDGPKALSEKAAKENGYRWEPEVLSNYAWWSEVEKGGVALPDSASVMYFHPIRFLRSLPMIADPLVWINDNPQVTASEGGEKSEIDFVGSGKVFDESGVSHSLKSGPGIESILN